MAIRATQVWIQVPAWPLPSYVMLGKSCNSLSLSFPFCTGESADQSVWPTGSHARGIISSAPGHTLPSATPGPFLPHASHTHLCPGALPCLTHWTRPPLLCGGHLLREAFPDPRGPASPGPWAPAVLWGSVRVPEDPGCVLSPVPSTGSAQSQGNIT